MSDSSGDITLTEDQRIRAGVRVGIGAVTCMAIAAAVSLATNILMARILGPSGRGEVAFVLQWVYVACPVLLMGTDRELLRGRAEHGWPNSGAFALGLGMAAVSAVAFAVARDAPWFLWFVPIVFLESCGTVLRARGLAERNLSTFAWVWLPFQAWVLASVVVLTAAGVTSVEIWLGAWGVPGLVAGVVAGVVVVRKRGTGQGLLLWPPQWAGIRLMPGSVGSIVLTRAERVLLPAFAGFSGLGIYVALATFTEVTTWLAQIAGEVFSKVDRIGRRAAGLLILLSSCVASALMGAGLFLFVGAILGPEFEAARSLILPLCLASVSLSSYRLLVGAILSSSRPEISSLVEVSSALLALIIYVVAIAGWGISGAAWGSFCSYSVGALAAYVGLVRSRRDDTSAL